MSYLEVTIQTTSEGIEQVAAMLTAGGFSDLVMEDQSEFESFLDENRNYWDYIDEELQQQLQGLSQIKLYLEDTDTQGIARLEALVEKIRRQDQKGKLGSLEMQMQPMADVDWEESWKENYPPVPVGEKLEVIPYWLADSVQPGRLPVILDPGLTFGTGAHPSTQMVMETMEQLNLSGWNCLDLGSGSGILSIAALRLGAAAAIGVDVDPKAEDIARENAAYNGYRAPEFTALTGNVTQDRELMDQLAQREYDLVLVNIVADVIIGLSPVLPQFLTERSVLICSGILDSRLEDVQNALQKVGLTVVQTKAKEDWRCVMAKRRMV